MIMLIFMVSGPVASAQSRAKTRRIEKRMAGNARKAPKEAKIKQPKAVIKAQKKQQQNESRLKKSNERAIKANKERHFSIQTEDVKARMKQNEKDIQLREKERKKKARQDSRKKGSAKRKYKKL